jgi:hypothetical protein
MFRRTNLAAAECPARVTLQRIAGFMGGELHWSTVEQERQIVQVEQVFTLLKN